ncbi:MAG: hypothetical protein KDK91_12170, partial [Gammaproteobacteria bacterium]|nr:hypothetical protein [Gammaproteobacteria bacterium]
MDKLAAWSPNLLALLVIALAGLGSSVATSRLARWRDARWLDRPNHRSLHERPTPRNGGLAIVGSILIGVLALSGIGGYHPNMGLLLLGVTPVTAVALLDDLTDLSVRARLLAQLVAAALLLLSLEALPPLTLPGMVPASPSAVPAPGVTALTGPVAWLGLYLFVIWMTNLYNFMDGMDGFAAGMTVYGFGTLALLGGLAGQAQFVLWCTLLCAAAGGFLRHNFPPARIFMG